MSYKTVNVKDQDSCWKNFQGTDCEQETVTLVCWTYQSQQLLHEWIDDKLEATFDEVDANDHIGGNYAAALNLETNLPNLIPEDYNAEAIFFLDVGNVWGVDYSDSIDESNKIRSSTGIGLNWASPIGPISFNFAQNLKKADTDETQSFSFNLGTTF